MRGYETIPYQAIPGIVTITYSSLFELRSVTSSSSSAAASSCHYAFPGADTDTRPYAGAQLYSDSCFRLPSGLRG